MSTDFFCLDCVSYQEVEELEMCMGIRVKRYCNALNAYVKNRKRPPCTVLHRISVCSIVKDLQCDSCRQHIELGSKYIYRKNGRDRKTICKKCWKKTKAASKQ